MEEGASISIKRFQPTPYSLRSCRRSGFRARLKPGVRLQSEGNRNGNYPHPPICAWLFPSLVLDDATAGAQRWPNKRQVLLMRKGVFHIPLGLQSHTSEAGGGKCVSCGQELPLHWGSPHVHHKVPLSKGGNHALSNLVLLCPGCHLTEHSNNKGLESLVYGVTTSPSRISRREQHFSNDMQQIITGAIKNQKKIEFFYKKPTESTYKKRTVRPIELNSVAHKHGVGRTLCVKGYCEQRKDIRHFAIKRMKNLRVI